MDCGEVRSDRVDLWVTVREVFTPCEAVSGLPEGNDAKEVYSEPDFNLAGRLLKKLYNKSINFG